MKNSDNSDIYYKAGLQSRRVEAFEQRRQSRKPTPPLNPLSCQTSVNSVWKALDFICKIFHADDIIWPAKYLNRKTL